MDYKIKNKFYHLSILINLMSKSRRQYHSIQPFQSINKSPTNRSSSKQTHSFSKEARFPPIRYDGRCPQLYYGGQSIKSNKNKASIGVGKKSDFTKDLTCSPSSAKYRVKDNFQMNKEYSKGCKIGSGREVNVYLKADCQICKLYQQINDQKPAIKQIQYQNPLFSMGSRTKILDKFRTIESLNDNPGPGEYNNFQIDRKSMHFLGQKKTSFSSNKSERFGKVGNRIPGPGSYDQVSNLSNVGKYSISKHRGGTIAKFLTERRITQFDKAAQKSVQIPGAGTYKAPSQFGNFMDDPMHERLKNISVHNPYTDKKQK